MAFEKVTLMRRSFLAIVLLLFYVPAWGATYYVDATGGNDSNSGTSTNTPWKTILKVNSSTLSLGDSILFKRGGTWREQLTVPSSGSAGNPITFGAYGIGASPIISGANIITNFTRSTTSASVYIKAGITIKPNQVFYNGIRLTKNDGRTTGVGSNEWDWAANTVYINVGEDPSSGTVEISQRNQVVWGAGRHHHVYDGLHLTKSNQYGFYIDSVDNVTIRNCEISYAANYGILLGTKSGDVLIDNNNIHNNGHNSTVGSGIFSYEDAVSVGHGNYIRGNIIENNYCFGINLNSNYYVIETNIIRNNGNTSTPYGCNGIEIVNLKNNGYGQHIIIRYNRVYGQISGGPDGTGICADDYSRYVDIYYNLAYGNDGPGIGAWKAKDVNIYNNTVYGNMLDSAASHTNGGEIAIGSNAADVSNMVVKNNIGQTTGVKYPAIRVDSNAYNSSGLSITNNIWYAAATNWYFWNTTGGSNLATWNDLTGIGMDINSNPSMTDPENGDFTLQSSSLAIDTGVNVGLKRDFVGNAVPLGAFPDVGAYEKQSAPPSGVTRTPSPPAALRIN